MNAEHFPSYADLARRAGPVRGTSWGVFGDHDQIGTLNHLDPARVRAALGSVRDGRTINLNLPLDAFDPPLIAHRGSPNHSVFGLNEYHRDDRVDNLFMQASTQIDGLRHFAHPDRGFYNQVPGSAIASGTADLGIQHVAQHGIVGRGVLVDVERHRREAGRPIDQASPERIPIHDVEAAIAAQGTDLAPGDILLLRFGWLAHMRRPGGVRSEPLTSPGLEQSEDVAGWIWNQQLAMVAADNLALEAWPAAGSPLTTEAETRGTLPTSSHTGMLHRILIPLLGLTIGELWDLDELSAHAERSGRFDCLVVAEPLNLTGGVGSPANALAIV